MIYNLIMQFFLLPACLVSNVFKHFKGPTFWIPIVIMLIWFYLFGMNKATKFGFIDKLYEGERGAPLIFVAFAFGCFATCSAVPVSGPFGSDMIGPMPPNDFASWGNWPKAFFTMFVFYLVFNFLANILYVRRVSLAIRHLVSTLVFLIFGNLAQLLSVFISKLGFIGAIVNIPMGFFLAVTIAVFPIVVIVGCLPIPVVKAINSYHDDMEKLRKRKSSSGTYSAVKSSGSSFYTKYDGNDKWFKDTQFSVQDENGFQCFTEIRGDYVYITTPSGKEVCKRVEDISGSSTFYVDGVRYFYDRR